VWRRQGFGAVGDYCTTRFENTHRTVRREVLYAHHSWFAHEVWVHAVIEAALWTVRRQTASWKFRPGCSTGLGAPNAM
jgi:hypothetical protein